MNIAVRQNREKVITSIEFDVDERQYIESFRQEMNRAYGEFNFYIDREYEYDNTIYNVYKYELNGEELFIESVSILNTNKM